MFLFSLQSFCRVGFLDACVPLVGLLSAVFALLAIFIRKYTGAFATVSACTCIVAVAIPCYRQMWPREWAGRVRGFVVGVWNRHCRASARINPATKGTRSDDELTFWEGNFVMAIITTIVVVIAILSVVRENRQSPGFTNHTSAHSI